MPNRKHLKTLCANLYSRELQTIYIQVYKITRKSSSTINYY